MAIDKITYIVRAKNNPEQAIKFPDIEIPTEEIPQEAQKVTIVDSRGVCVFEEVEVQFHSNEEGDLIVVELGGIDMTSDEWTRAWDEAEETATPDLKIWPHLPLSQG